RPSCWPIHVRWVLAVNPRSSSSPRVRSSKRRLRAVGPGSGAGFESEILLFAIDALRNATTLVYFVENASPHPTRVPRAGGFSEPQGEGPPPAGRPRSLPDEGPARAHPLRGQGEEPEAARFLILPAL